MNDLLEAINKKLENYDLDPIKEMSKAYQLKVEDLKRAQDILDGMIVDPNSAFATEENNKKEKMQNIVKMKEAALEKMWKDLQEKVLVVVSEIRDAIQENQEEIRRDVKTYREAQNELKEVQNNIQQERLREILNIEQGG